MTKIQYPHTRQMDVKDDYHGTSVSDPYRWLEDTDAPETHEWIAAQNVLTRQYLDVIPQRAAIRQRLMKLWDFPKQSAPFKKGGRYFQFRNTGLQNQDVLYTFEALAAEPRLLLDPNTLSNDGTVALTNFAVSPDGRLLAYATSASGSDWLTWRVREVENGNDRPDLIEWSKFAGAAWRKDASGFYYARYDAPTEGAAYTGANFYHKLYFHRLGDAQAEDTLIYHRPDHKDWNFGPAVTDDGRYLVLNVSQGTDERNRFFYCTLDDAPTTSTRSSELPQQQGFIELIPDLEAAYHFVGNDGPVFYFRTNLDAPRGKLIAIDTADERLSRQTILPQHESDVLESVTMASDLFVARYMQNAHHVLKTYDRLGRLSHEIALPTLGSLATVNAEREDDEFFYSFQSFVYPPTNFRFNVKSGKGETLDEPQLAFDAAQYETRQVFARSKDGTQVPLCLIHRQGLPLTGNNPTFLYGYGGFNIPLLPLFMVSRLAWLEMGGVLAIANLRGGGEYGAEWHASGSLHSKQNVFDDFIACAEYLIAAKVTKPARLAIHGRSNGGLLVGATLNQRPDLFGAALPYVGVMDMLRFHKFTIGWAWVSDYGSAENSADFPVLFSYSPLHNIRQGYAYPPTLITTADHDDRVVPGHSFKYAAALQAAQGGDAPILIRIDTKAGHGFGKPTTMLIDDAADMWAFLAATIGKGVMG